MKEYKVTLEMPGMQTSFTTDNKEGTLKAFEEKAVLILNKPNGDQFAIRMEDYTYIAIDALQKEGVEC